jgi:hypothetical protein
MHVGRENIAPVFVDRTGRRRRLFAAAGAGGGVLLALASLALVAGFTGNTAGFLPPLPEPAASAAHGAASNAVRSPTVRPTSSSPLPTAGHHATASTASTAPAVTSSPAAVTPSPTHTNHRRVPSHKPTKSA